EISWNNLSNATKFALFRVCMNKICPLEVGLFRESLIQILEGEKKRRKEEKKQDSSRSFKFDHGFCQGVITT
ncbi:hypothetical protein H5410_002975, partial [Solanum commersonii]